MPHQNDDDITLAESVRAACLNAAVLAYEDAGIRGLCAEGRWEAAVAAIGQVDLWWLKRRTDPAVQGKRLVRKRALQNSAPSLDGRTEVRPNVSATCSLQRRDDALVVRASP
jgi:hypothetical protein